MSEESVNMKSMSPLPFLESIITSEQNGYFLEDRSLEESAVTVPEAAPSNFDEIISVDGVPWAWSDKSSDESIVMESQESISCFQIPRSGELNEFSMEFGVTLEKIISPDSSGAKKTSDRNRILNQEAAGTLWKSMKSVIASSSKEPKQVNVLNVDENRKRELPILRSSLPVRTSLLGRIEAKKKVDEVAEFSITKEKSPTLNRTVKSVKLKQAVGIKEQGTSFSPTATLNRTVKSVKTKEAVGNKEQGTSFSPTVIKKKTMEPSKIIQLSPIPAVLPKSQPTMVKNKSQMIVSERIIPQNSRTASKPGEDKALKLLGASQAPKSSLYCGMGMNYRKVRLVKNHLGAGNVDSIKEKALHVVERTGTALKSAEQNHINPTSEEPFRVLSSRSSIPHSSNSKEENDDSQMTIRDDSGSKKVQIDIGKWKAPLYNYHGIQREANVCLEDELLSPGKSSITSSSMSSLSPSALMSSSSKEDGDGSKLIISDVSGSKKTQIGQAKGRKAFSDYKIIQKSTENASLENKSSLLEKMPFRRAKEVILPKENTEAVSETDVQENNTQYLFNDVIESTASKLVEIRKSKVKALVGAFESIISLREGKV